MTDIKVQWLIIKIMKMKKCRVCEKFKDLDEFYFRKDSNSYRKDCKICVNRRTCAYSKEKGYDYSSRNTHYVRRYGITVEDFGNILKLQDGKCAICNELETCTTKKRLHVDHCHVTGKVRGLLCHKCNAGLGNLKDSLVTLENASIYLLNYIHWLQSDLSLNIVDSHVLDDHMKELEIQGKFDNK